MTDNYESRYALAIEEGMSAEEAHEWAESRARARKGPVGGVGMLGEGTNNPTDPTQTQRAATFGMGGIVGKAASRGEPKWVVDGMLPQGLSILAGASKIGKSFMALDIAYGVAAGAPVIGQMVPEPGDVLYLALEDTSTRIVGRLNGLEPERGEWPMERLTIVSQDMTAEVGPLGVYMGEWAEAVENPTLVMIDTITRFGGLGERSGYAAEVQWMSRFHDFAAKHGVCLLGLTHTNQMKFEEGDDWFNKISGTTGIIGTADNVMLLDVKRGENEGMLRIEGRDMDPTEYALRKAGPWWQQTSQIRGRRGDVSVEIGDFVIQMGTTTTAEVAEHFGMSRDKASVYLGRLRRAAVISQPKRGTWSG